jgi:hypothetical protein
VPLQFLHIGKTGGSFVRAVVNSLPPEHRAEFRLLHHDAKLAQAIETRPGMPVFFSVRRPEDLFVSAFHSRLRRGRPLYDRPWNSREEIAFSVFETPNQLAEALSAEDRLHQAAARFSMFAINHVRQGLRWYLVNAENLERHREHIAFVLLQESLDEDLRTFAGRLGIPLDSAEQLFGERVHGSAAGSETALSERAVANLQQWYHDDIQIYDWCVDFHHRMLDRADRA